MLPSAKVTEARGTTTADTFGSRYATVNTGLMYTAKGTASLLVPLANVMANAENGWHTVFITAAIMNFIAAAMAVVVLKPMRLKFAQRTTAIDAGTANATA